MRSIVVFESMFGNTLVAERRGRPPPPPSCSSYRPLPPHPRPGRQSSTIAAGRTEPEAHNRRKGDHHGDRHHESS